MEKPKEKVEVRDEVEKVNEIDLNSTITIEIPKFLKSLEKHQP